MIEGGRRAFAIMASGAEGAQMTVANAVGREVIRQRVPVELRRMPLGAQRSARHVHEQRQSAAGAPRSGERPRGVAADGKMESPPGDSRSELPERRPLVHREVVRRVALDFVLRLIAARVDGVALELRG